MIRRLYLNGHVRTRPGHKVTSYYSWPWGLEIKFVEALIDSFKSAFQVENIELEHCYDD